MDESTIGLKQQPGFGLAQYEVQKVLRPTTTALKNMCFLPPSGTAMANSSEPPLAESRGRGNKFDRHIFSRLDRSAARLCDGSAAPTPWRAPPPPHPNTTALLRSPLAASVGVSRYFGTQHINRISPLVTCLLWYL